MQASPLESNFLEVHYVIEGAADTPYEGGYYHGAYLLAKTFGSCEQQ